MKKLRASGSSAAKPASSAEASLAHIQRLLQQEEFGSIGEANAFLAKLVADTGGRIEPPSPTSSSEEAQELIYEAWDCEGRRRTNLAKKALALDPNCADAYILLAEDAKTSGSCIELLEQAVAAAERGLPKHCFEDRNWVGRFWGILETRPYMRARQLLADAQWHSGDRERAVAHYQELLRLNPNDNQGVRYDLIAWLIVLGRDADALRILMEYTHDPSAVMLYERALLEFKMACACPKADKALAKAFRANSFVPAIYAMSEPPPLPDSYGFGDVSEGIVASDTLLEPFNETPGAAEWLFRVCGPLMK
jgi:tetratricopeptide (TPR) repeat protein